LEKKKVAIVQSNYIPWKGYFDLIAAVDEFILFDDVQYTRRDWRNRNLIKTAKGTGWLTIPVDVKGKYYQSIKDTKVADKEWNKRHWEIIKCNYSKAKHYNDFKHKFEDLYLNFNEEYLSQINYRFISSICKILNIDTKISLSSDYGIIDGKSERLLDLCLKANAHEYHSGPAAKEYLNEELFKESKIMVKWMDYSGYKSYLQLHEPFEHKVSVIDLIFNCGNDATKYLKFFGKS